MEKHQDREFLQCPSRLHNLIDQYFKPHVKGFDKELIDATFSLTIPDTAVVQVLDGKIYVGRQSNLYQEWDRSRFETMLYTLNDYLKRLKEACADSVGSRPTVCDVDFEFVMVLRLAKFV